MWLDFSSRFPPSPPALSHPCYLVWFRFLSSRAKFQFPQLIRYSFQPTPENMSFSIKCCSLVLGKEAARSNIRALSMSFLPVPGSMSETLELRRWGARDVSVISLSLKQQLLWGPRQLFNTQTAVHTTSGWETRKGTMSDCSRRGLKWADVITFGAPLYLPTSGKFMNSFLFEKIKDYIQPCQPRLASRNSFKMCLHERDDPRRENANTLNHSSEGSAPGRQKLRVLPQKILNQFFPINIFNAPVAMVY